MTWNDVWTASLTIEEQLEDLDDADRILGSYHRWLHAIAYYLHNGDDPYHDDLVQEGRIAMWKALSTYDSSKGALPTWITTAGKMRMRDCVRRELWTGAAKRYGHGGKRPDEGTTVMSLMDDDLALTEMLNAAELLESVEIAYHRGQILQAINRLSVNQRRYVVGRFWLGMDPRHDSAEFKEFIGVKHPRSLWSLANDGARDRLHKTLEHLATV